MCAAAAGEGTKVHYEQYDLLGHIASLVPWLPNSIAWIQQRFEGLPVPQNCSSITSRRCLAAHVVALEFHAVPVDAAVAFRSLRAHPLFCDAVIRLGPAPGVRAVSAPNVSSAGAAGFIAI
jgi:hypothetical protein